MLKERGFLVTQFFLLWTLVSLGTCSEAFTGNDVDYEGISSTGLFLKERCSENPYLLPCHFYREEIEDSGKDELLPENYIFNKLSEENSVPEALPIINSDSSLEKRFSVFRRRNPTAQGYKRGPGFRSWGGKRNTEVSVDKRTKFTSWGGKRDFYDQSIKEDESNEKRSKFANWGGKRDFDDLIGKRSKFRSWGGKRDAENPVSYDQKEKREPFWLSKGSYMAEPFKKHVPKRPQFQSWGGKRAIPWDTLMAMYFNRYQSPKFDYTKLNGEEKRHFSSWGGKRFDSNLNTLRSKNLNSLKSRQIFQNWGGKRTVPDEDVPDTPGDVFPLKLQSQEPSPSSYDNEMSLGRQKREEVIKTYNKNFPQESRFNFNSWQGKGGEDKISR